MPTTHWAKVKFLFEQAVDLPVNDRAAFCDAHCDSESMKVELLRLLDAHEEDTGFLKSPFEATESSEISDAFIGRAIGDFRITRRIGAGGMGVVYEAIQEHPGRSVAIKLLQPGHSCEKLLWRLQHESEILARLQHPGVAHVYASGMTDFGYGPQPWFAMELVDGLPLHRHMQQHDLSTERKLVLFLEIADAVQHAHERGVIHRDLKPANIMMAGDSAGSILSHHPKILDFGVARIIDESGNTGTTMRTANGEIAGTIGYMSPERFSGEDNVDHRCDVYALGVIGYELLTKTLPIDVRSHSLVEAIRAVEQQSPVPLRTVAPTLSADLEVIFSKCLEKDPTRRYQSARDLADDVRRFLQREPIRARRASRGYLFRKFVSRNRTLVGGIVATILALAAGMFLYAVEAKQARAEAEKSQYEADKALAINSFMTNDFITRLIPLAKDSSDPQHSTVTEIVGEAARHVPTMFGERPAIEAAVRNEIGTVYYNMGDHPNAVEQYELALQLWTSQLGPSHVDTLKAVNNLGLAFARQGNNKAAEPLYRRAWKGRIAKLGESHSSTLASMNNLAEAVRANGRPEEAEQLLRRAYELQLAEAGLQNKQTLIMLANLGSLLAKQGRHKEAEKIHRTVFENMATTLGEDHVTTLWAQLELAQSIYRLKDYDAAKEVLIPVVETFERTNGAADFSTITARRLMGRILRGGNDHAAARATLQLALDAANTDSDTFARVIPKIERDLRRLEDE